MCFWQACQDKGRLEGSSRGLYLIFKYARLLSSRVPLYTSSVGVSFRVHYAPFFHFHHFFVTQKSDGNGKMERNEYAMESGEAAKREVL